MSALRSARNVCGTSMRRPLSKRTLRASPQTAVRYRWTPRSAASRPPNTSQATENSKLKGHIGSSLAPSGRRAGVGGSFLRMGIIANCAQPPSRPTMGPWPPPPTDWCLLVQDRPILKACTARVRDRILSVAGPLFHSTTGWQPESLPEYGPAACGAGDPDRHHLLASPAGGGLDPAPAPGLAGTAAIFTTPVQLAKPQIAAARSEIERLIELLTNERQVASRGVAMASQLLTEPGPVYRMGPHGTALAQAVAEVNQVLADG